MKKLFMTIVLLLFSTFAFAHSSMVGVYSTNNNELVLQIMNNGTKAAFYQNGMCVGMYNLTHYDDSHVSFFDLIEGNSIEIRWDVKEDKICIYDFIVNEEDLADDDSPDIFYRREPGTTEIADGNKI